MPVAVRMAAVNCFRSVGRPPGRSRPYAPRCTPVSTASRWPLSTRPCTSCTTSTSARLRLSAAQQGDYAESALVPAAVLHLDECARAPALLLDARRREGRAVRLNPGQVVGIGERRAPRLQQRVQHLLFLVVGNQLDTGQLGAFLRVQGGIAAGHGDARAGIALVEMPRGLAALARGPGQSPRRC